MFSKYFKIFISERRKQTNAIGIFVDAFKFNIKFDIFVRYLIFLIQLVRLLTGFY